MAGYVLSPRAKSDIKEIWDYTAQRWDEAQTEQYLRDLQWAIEHLAAHRRRGVACDEIRTGYFRFSVGSHIIFYRISKKTVDVVRILHQRMDYRRHL